MLGRQVSNSLCRLSTHARLPWRSSPFQCQHDLSSLALLCSSHRFYATPGRPRKAVGEPSKPVKRAVKRSAKSASSPDSPAKEKVTAKKKAAEKKKPKPKARQLTPEQKAVQKSKAQISELKKAALSPPSRTKMSAYLMFMKENLKDTDESKASMKDRFKTVVPQFKNLSSAELEHYNHLAHTATEANLAEYKRWVETHTPEQIHIANIARRSLRRKLGVGKRSQKYGLIQDERHVKRPVTSFMQFNINRQASGDFTNIPVTERVKLISKEWKALNENEKTKYKELHSEDRDRYSTEHNNVYGHMPPRMSNGQPQAVAAAA